LIGGFFSLREGYSDENSSRSLVSGILTGIEVPKALRDAWSRDQQASSE